jgi:hypothetical protein
VAGAVCWRCIEDEYLKEIVRENGKLTECSLCEAKKSKAFTAAELAEVLDPIMQEHFEQGPEVKKFGPDDEEWWEQEGDPLSFHIQEVIGNTWDLKMKLSKRWSTTKTCGNRMGTYHFSTALVTMSRSQFVRTLTTKNGIMFSRI